MIVAAPFAAPTALVCAVNAVGFGAAGVTAGSIAAGIQSAVYGGAVGAGSLFAWAQSVGAGGAMLAGAAPVASTGATAIAAVGAWMGLRDDPRPVRRR
ncbi:hypothetical protein GGX14DRAFT_483711 [Mycena pura]|uniref:Uncharacterized protein n=1 Tax=Mycena pura TaxID=153505 RepID=A0AAD6ULW8_9AGAR|nr:hypothetical protein GGX14DRAFT_483711 [Mycena pura]